MIYTYDTISWECGINFCKPNMEYPIYVRSGDVWNQTELLKKYARFNFSLNLDWLISSRDWLVAGIRWRQILHSNRPDRIVFALLNTEWLSWWLSEGCWRPYQWFAPCLLTMHRGMLRIACLDHGLGWCICLRRRRLPAYSTANPLILGMNWTSWIWNLLRKVCDSSNVSTQKVESPIDDFLYTIFKHIVLS